MESARQAGADVAPLDFWRREADFDVLHLWGLELQHSSTVKWAHAGDKRVVLSALLNYPGWKSAVRHLASLVVGPARMRRSMLAMIDCVTVVNKEQAKFLVSTIGFPPEKVMVVPNLVEEIFFGTGTKSEVDVVDVANYVLCTGNVCRRKNQLALVSACQALGVSLVLVGKVLTGEENYGRAVEDVIVSAGFRWIKGLGPGSLELAAAYSGAAVFALPSHEETQPISALEAAASGKPLVLGDRPYARQEFYAGAALADPHSVKAIAGAIQKTLDHPELYCPPISVIEPCRRKNVGAAYMAIYQRLGQGSD
jgi:glycosyltransferase involved in cell wall biosynthesis